MAGNGLCHSDIGMAAMPGSIGESLGWRLPFTLGHEVGGWVDALGPASPTWPRATPWPWCRPLVRGVLVLRAGQDSACPHGLAGRGYERDGGLATYVVAAAPREVVRLDTLDPVVAGPLMDAGATSYLRGPPGAAPAGAGLDRRGAGRGRAGRLRRAVPAGAQPRPHRGRRQQPRPGCGSPPTSGAHATVAGVDEGTAATLREQTGGAGAQVVLDFVGVDATLAAGLASVRSYGAFGLVGAGGGTSRRPWFGGLPARPTCSRSRGRRSRTPTRSCAWRRPAWSPARSTCSRDDVEIAYDKLARGTLRGRAVVIPSP